MTRLTLVLIIVFLIAWAGEVLGDYHVALHTAYDHGHAMQWAAFAWDILAKFFGRLALGILVRIVIRIGERRP